MTAGMCTMEQPRLNDSNDATIPCRQEEQWLEATATRWMDRVHAGDVVVSHVNGTIDLYLIATVQSAEGDLGPRERLDDEGPG
jgi:hypothetical protein